MASTSAPFTAVALEGKARPRRAHRRAIARVPAAVGVVFVAVVAAGIIVIAILARRALASRAVVVD
jgi:hypothetical protein